MPNTPMTPSPPHEALAFFEGTWTTEELPELEFRETCAWLNAGRRHMVCRSTWTESGPREGMSIFSYRPKDGKYLYYGLRSGGSVEVQTGYATPDGWEFQHEEGTGDTRVRTRVTIMRLSGDRFRLVAESAEGDGPWNQEDTVHYRRVE